MTSKDPGVSNSVCWVGSVDGFAGGSVDRFARIVLPAGDRAFEVADEKFKDFYRDTRGLARALAGRRRDAIDDFRAFISWAEKNNLQHDRVSKRVEWIGKLEKGEQPFTPEVLLELRNENIVSTLD